MNGFCVIFLSVCGYVHKCVCMCVCECVQTVTSKFHLKSSSLKQMRDNNYKIQIYGRILRKKYLKELKI